MAGPAASPPRLGLSDAPGPLRHPPGAQLREFLAVFCGRDVVPWALARSYGGGLKRSRLRTVYWRLTMGDFPRGGLPAPTPPWGCQHTREPSGLEPTVAMVESWVPHIKTRREAYRRLKETVFAPPRSGAALEEDATANNPLEHGNAEWRAYFQRLEWGKVIEKDLARLDLRDDLDPFFALPQMQAAMRAVIITWASANDDVGYKQGMHELAAVLLLLVVRDSRRRALEEEELPPLAPDDVGPDANLRRALNALLDFAEFEADCYALFDLLLNRFRLREWYTQELGVEWSAAQRCLHIQNTLVATIEPMLAEHLVQLGVEPQVYALRWLRLLFLREFVLEDCFVLWDAIFAHGYVTGQGCELARWVMVAMLRYVKTDLLEADYALCIRRLMRFPPTPEVHHFVSSALEIACNEVGLKFLLAYQQDTVLAREDEEYQSQCASPVDSNGEPSFDTSLRLFSADGPGPEAPKRKPKGLFDSDSDAEAEEAIIRRKMALLLSKDEADTAPSASHNKPSGPMAGPLTKSRHDSLGDEEVVADPLRHWT